jgi:IS5 family transposase
VAFLRRKGIAPHIAQIESRKTPGLDARTTRHASYWISQRKRKRVEEIFGWMKAYGGLRRMRMRGIARVQLHAHLVGAAYNLLRLSRLAPATG